MNVTERWYRVKWQGSGRAMVVGVGLWLWASTAWAAEGGGQQLLAQFLDGLVTMKAALIQTQHDAAGKMIDESRGTLWLSRPGRFRLEYSAPIEQSFIADGRNLWLYDKELEQVTVKPQDDSLGSTPALLLSGTQPLTEAFTLEELGEHSGMVWLALYPRSADATFDSIRIAMEEGVLRAMEMVDGFGQTTRLYMDELQRNPSLDAAQFRFSPPEGVDLIGTPE